MNARKTHTLLLALLSFVLSSFTISPEEDFKAGNDHYANSRYAQAIESYEKVLNANVESAALYYNMANAHYKLNNIAPSIFYFEKAKQLAPLDKEIKNNAAFAENMKIDAISTLPQNTVKKWVNGTVSILTIDGWAKTAVVFAILFVLLFLGYLFTVQSGKKRAFFITAFVSLLVTGASVGFSYYAFAKASADNPAIVFATKVEIKSEPNLASTSAFTLHEGTKVQVLESLGNWSRIQLSDGKIGWIPEDDIKLLNDF